MRLLVLILLLPITSSACAFNWTDLWTTPDRQAQTMMHKGEFSAAEKKFKRPDWQALAAFRAGHYKKAASAYQNLKNNEYNQGNALAYAGQLEAALQAYNKAIANNPDDNDARYNRKIVEALLKKKQEQEKQDQDQQKQDQQKQDQQKQDQQKQDQQNQDQQNQDQQNQDQQNQDQQNQDQQNQDQQNQDQQNQDQQKQDQQKQDQQAKPQESEADSNKTKQEEREQNAAKKQWLKLIPDDPGGLLREKFLRDYLRNQARHPE